MAALNLLATIVGFLLTMTLIMLILDSCYFNVQIGCGRRNRPENFKTYKPDIDAIELEMEDVDPTMNVSADDNIQALASVDASGPSETQHPKAPSFHDNTYMSAPPYGAPFRGNEEPGATNIGGRPAY